MLFTKRYALQINDIQAFKAIKKSCIINLIFIKIKRQTLF